MIVGDTETVNRALKCIVLVNSAIMVTIYGKPALDSGRENSVGLQVFLRRPDTTTNPGSRPEETRDQTGGRLGPTELRPRSRLRPRGGTGRGRRPHVASFLEQVTAHDMSLVFV